jgi:hypothetical protein
MTNKENDSRQFIRNLEVGYGKVLSSTADKIQVQLINNDGTIKNDIHEYELNSWKIKKLSEESFGRFFYENHEVALKLIDNYDLKIISLCLKELGGRATLNNLKEILEPILTTKGNSWNAWWKRISQKIRKEKLISYNRVEKVYFLDEDAIDSQTFLSLTPESISTLSDSNYVDLTQVAFEKLSIITDVDRNIVFLLWRRLCEVLVEKSPKDNNATALLAFGQLLSENLSIEENWSETVKGWINESEVNLWGLRNLKVRNKALNAISKIRWSKKIETLSSYIVNEESGEKNRKNAFGILWKECEKNPKIFFKALIKSTNAIQIVEKNPLQFLSARPRRVLNSHMEFIRSTKSDDQIRDFYEGDIELLLSFFSKFFKMPFESDAAKTMLNIWIDWKEKIQTLVPKKEWILWSSDKRLLRACNSFTREKFFKQHEENNKWIVTINSFLLDKANIGDMEETQILFDVLSMIAGNEEAEKRLSSALRSGKIYNNTAQEWAMSILIYTEDEKELETEGSREIQNEISNLVFHPREREISQYFSRLLIFYKERENKLKEIKETFSELINLYDPSLIEMVQEFESFSDLLSLNLEELKRQLHLNFIGSVGKIEPFNPIRHQVITDEREKVKFVKIITPGVEILRKGVPPEIIQKAIVTYATGGQS